MRTLPLCVGLLALVLPARAQDALVTYKSLATETALELARATLSSCCDRGFQVALACPAHRAVKPMRPVPRPASRRCATSSSSER
jgi:hypothetical protein